MRLVEKGTSPPTIILIMENPKKGPFILEKLPYVRDLGIGQVMSPVSVNSTTRNDILAP